MIAGRSTRMEVLELLRRKGHASAETIASDLSVTPNAVRQHLTNLERDVAWIGRAGTLAEQTETAEGVKVTIHNCPFRNTALKFPQVCTITPHLMSRLLDAAVSQSDSIHRRDPFCSFIVQRPNPA